MAETLARLFRHTISFKKSDTILSKESGEYRPIAASELYRRVGRLRLELANAGVEPGDRCALLSENRWEWAVADFAMMSGGFVSVPIYPTLEAEQIEFLLKHSECKVAVVSTKEQLQKIQEIWERLPKLEGVIAFDSVKAEDERIVQLSQLIGSEALTSDQTEAFDRIAGSIDGIRNLRRVPMLRGRIIEIAGTSVSQIKAPPEFAWILRGDRGLTWARTPPKAGSKVVAGEWWPADYSGPPLLSLDAAAAQGLGIEIGEMIRLNVLGREFEAKVANLRRIEWNSFAINFVMILAPGVLDGAPQAHIATARADDPAIEIALERAVAKQFNNVSAIRVREVMARLEELVGHLAMAVRVIGMVVIFAGVLVLSGAIAASHKQRVYDAVVLKVFGATRRDIMTVFCVEFACLAIATSVIAVLIGAAASWGVVTRLMRAEWTFLPTEAAMTVLLCLVVTVLIGALGTWSAMGRKAAPLLRNE